MVVERAALSVHGGILDGFSLDERYVICTGPDTQFTNKGPGNRQGIRRKARLGIHALQPACGQVRSGEPILSGAGSASEGEDKGSATRRCELGALGIVVERARVTRNSEPGAALAPAQLFPRKLARHAPGSPAPPASCV